MSAKHSKKGGQKPAPTPAAPAPAAEPVTAPAGGIPAPATEAHVAWMDSADPQKRRIGKIVFVAVWIYAAALWLLALDQTFGWGIFGPKVAPVS